MKHDARNIAITLLLVTSSLGIGRTGFVWHERLEEQAAHISDLEDQVLQVRGMNAALEHNLDVAQRRASLFDDEPSGVSIASDDDREDRVASDDDVSVTPVAVVPQTPEIDVAFLQSAMAQLQLLQDQQSAVTVPKPAPVKSPSKTTNDTPTKRSRTTRAS